ncbi:hypothetical protein GA0115253_100807 [Streptomyces sp. Termitarium-T10T-6]|nr:hypothetical protein GA0115253_100807 [Streptomyces sp. Termitarium-T10T-6]
MTAPRGARRTSSRAPQPSGRTKARLPATVARAKPPTQTGRESSGGAPSRTAMTHRWSPETAQEAHAQPMESRRARGELSAAPAGRRASRIVHATSRPTQPGRATAAAATSTSGAKTQAPVPNTAGATRSPAAAPVVIPMTRPSPKAAIIRSGAMPTALPSWTWARTPQMRPGTNLLMTPMKKMRAVSLVRAGEPPSTTRTRQESMDRTSPAALATRAALSRSTPPGRPAASASSVPAARSEPPTAKAVAATRTSAAAGRSSRAHREGRGAAFGAAPPRSPSSGGRPLDRTASASAPGDTAPDRTALRSAPLGRTASGSWFTPALTVPPPGPDRRCGRGVPAPRGRSAGPPASARRRPPRRARGPGAPRSAAR